LDANKPSCYSRTNYWEQIGTPTGVDDDLCRQGCPFSEKKLILVSDDVLALEQKETFPAKNPLKTPEVALFQQFISFVFLGLLQQGFWCCLAA
jgi:hypothetical protein